MNVITFLKATILTISTILLVVAANMANASESKFVPSLSKDIQKGEIITSNMITSLEVPKKKNTRHIFTHADEIFGKEAKRFMRAGQPLYKKNFRERPVVRKGAVTNIVFKKSGLLLTTEGIAMNDASIGETVSFVKTGSKRLLKGQAQQNGSIQVN